MKGRYTTLVLLCSVIVLTGCAARSPVSSEPPTPEGVDYAAEEHYVEAFGEGYTYTGEREAVFEDRHFLLEDLPENEAEELAALHYYDTIAGEWERLEERCGEEALQISARNTAKSFEEGSYIREYLIHDLAVMTQEELCQISEGDLSEFYREKAWERAEAFSLETFTVVKVDLTWAYSEEALARGPQLPEGRYQRGLLCGKQNAEDDWSIYDIYWFE